MREPSSKREAYVGKLKAQLDKRDAEAERLGGTDGTAQADVNVQYQHQIEALRACAKIAEAKLQDLEEAAREALRYTKHITRAAENAWNELQEAHR